MYKPSEALNIGMVDEVVPQDQVLDTAKEEIQKWIKIPGKIESYLFSIVQYMRFVLPRFYFSFFVCLKCICTQLFFWYVKETHFSTPLHQHSEKTVQ